MRYYLFFRARVISVIFIICLFVGCKTPNEKKPIKKSYIIVVMYVAPVTTQHGFEAISPVVSSPSEIDRSDEGAINRTFFNWQYRVSKASDSLSGGYMKPIAGKWYIRDSFDSIQQVKGVLEDEHKGMSYMLSTNTDDIPHDPYPDSGGK